MSYENILLAIDTLVRSPVVDYYLIGITRNVKVRRASYNSKAIGCKLFYILETDLDADSAIEMEERLFTEVTSNKQRLLYKKYNNLKRDSSHRVSFGGRKGEDSNYSVYIAVWVKED